MSSFKMFEGLFESKFHKKCKSCLEATKIRLETIRKKRNAIQKFWRNDIAVLLASGLDINAYRKAENLLAEMNISCCYDMIQEFSECISNHLSDMDKHMECPEECREAVPSLMYAAARFADLPELRAFRSLFTQKYGESLEVFINKEFVDKLRAKPPTKDMKLQLMQEIAQEASIEWDSKALEQTLHTPLPPLQDQPKHGSSGYSYNDDYRKLNILVENVPRRYNQDDGYEGRDKIPSNIDDKIIDDDRRLHICRENEHARQDQGESQRRSNLLQAASQEKVAAARKQNPFYYGLIPPYYAKSKVTPIGAPKELAVNEDENHRCDDLLNERKESKSVRSTNLKFPPSHIKKTDNSKGDQKQGMQVLLGSDNDDDGQDEKGARIDGVFSHFIGSSYDTDKVRLGKNYDNTAKNDKGRDGKHTRGISLPAVPTTTFMEDKGSRRASSLQPDRMMSHVHPKLPDYDDLVDRIAALSGR